MKHRLLVPARRVCGLVALGFLPLAVEAWAQAQTPSRHEEQKRLANANVVTIAASSASSTYTRFAEDIQNVLDDTGRDGLRVLPMLGRGGGQNFNDILFVKGVDLGTTDAEYMRYYQKLDPKLYANVNQRVQYITKLFNAEFHVLAPRSVRSIQDLRGRRVNFWKQASISAMAAEVVFGTLGIEVEPTHYDNRLAIEKLKSGEIIAMVRMSGAPHDDYDGIMAGDGFHLLSLDETTAPRDRLGKLLDIYAPSQLTHEQYPQLIPQGRTVRTVAGSTVLAVYGWPEGSERYMTLTKFVNRFFDNIERFHNPARHPKWRDINLTAKIPGWVRFKPAQQWLDAYADRVARANNEDMKAAFENFLEEYRRTSNRPALTAAQESALYQDFLTWWKARDSTVTRN
jgi:TRAP-type uncharacterized transport system substrate-binding protein